MNKSVKCITDRDSDEGRGGSAGVVNIVGDHGAPWEGPAEQASGWAWGRESRLLF